MAVPKRKPVKPVRPVAKPKAAAKPAAKAAAKPAAKAAPAKAAPAKAAAKPVLPLPQRTRQALVRWSRPGHPGPQNMNWPAVKFAQEKGWIDAKGKVTPLGHKVVANIKAAQAKK